MSPKRTRAATAKSAVSTRSKAQKINNVSQDMAKSAQVRQSQRKEKLASVKKKNTVKQSNRKESPEVTLKGSAKKRTGRRKLYLDEDAPAAQDDQNVKLDESMKLLRDRHCDNIVMVKLIKTNLLHLNVSKGLEKTPNELQQKAKMSPVIVTPKSTPPKLSLTPHRSKKTPKKSPISLGSPKTHSIAIPKLFKSPRKLSLAAAGKDSESLENSSNSHSNSHSKKSRKKKKGSLGNSPKSDKSASTSLTAKNKHKKSDINLKVIVRKFSKSPKIVLRSPKAKKSKQKVRKLKSPSQVRKNTSSMSPDATSSLKSANTSRINAKESPLAKGEFLSPIKRHLLNPKLEKTLTASQIKDVLAEPVVLLEKLSPESMKRKYMVARKIQSSTSVKVKSPLSEVRSNYELLVSKEKASTDASPKRNSSTNLRNSSMEKRTSNTDRASPRAKHNTSIQGKNRSPLMSSTPRLEKTALRDTSLAISNTSIDSANNASFNTRLTRHKNQSNTQLSSMMDKSTGIENVSTPSLFDKEINDTSQSRLSNVMKWDTTYDKDNTMEKKQRDNTYELEQPQTLSLRQMVKKRTSINANLSSRDDTVKKAKVRFADVTTGASSAQKSVNKLNGSRSGILHNVGAQHRNNVMNSAKISMNSQKSQTKKAQSPKFARNSLISPFKRSSPRAHGGTPSTQLSKINQVTPKTFASVEKKSEKKSSMKKKVPNFGRIHEEMFAKSESLVDAKKRLEARHLAFIANRILKEGKTDQKKLLPSDTRDGIHNRFGFKLKKPEATHIILKKQTVFSREKQQAETRMILQGVRTNRRFELQMKARNLNA